MLLHSTVLCNQAKQTTVKERGDTRARGAVQPGHGGEGGGRGGGPCCHLTTEQKSTAREGTLVHEEQ